MASTKHMVGATAVESTAEDRKIIADNCARATSVRNGHIERECAREFDRSNIARRLRGAPELSREDFLAAHPEYLPPDDPASPAFAEEQEAVNVGDELDASPRRAASSSSSSSSSSASSPRPKKKTSAKKRASKK